MQNKIVQNVFPNHKFKNNMFYSQIGTRNKTVLIYHGLLDGDWGDYLKTNRERRTWGSHDFKFIVPKEILDFLFFSGQ